MMPMGTADLYKREALLSTEAESTTFCFGSIVTWVGLT